MLLSSPSRNVKVASVRLMWWSSALHHCDRGATPWALFASVLNLSCPTPRIFGVQLEEEAQLIWRPRVGGCLVGWSRCRAFVVRWSVVGAVALAAWNVAGILEHWFVLLSARRSNEGMVRLLTGPFWCVVGPSLFWFLTHGATTAPLAATRRCSSSSCWACGQCF